MSHGRTSKGGSFKGKRDKHEKVQRNTARDKPAWENQSGKRDRGIVEQVVDAVLGRGKRR